jgi:hypothetical protein
MDFMIQTKNGLPTRRSLMQTLQELYHEKKSLELNWEQEHLKEGRYTLNMVRIDHKVRELISNIKAKEADLATLQNKVDDAAPEVSVAT